MKRLGATLIGLLTLTACGPSETRKAELAEERRVECLDKFCEGDLPLQVDVQALRAFKVNGRWFTVPKEYGGGHDPSLAFYWPSKTPKTGRADRASYPEQGKSYYDVAIEIFLRSNHSKPIGPSRYQALLAAQADGRVIERTKPRAGLEVWRVRDEIGGLPPAVWYVAAALRDSAGEPPVIGCDDENPKFDRCTMAFWWQPGVAVDIRFRGRYGTDWPEIYQEVMRVLELVKGV